MTTRVSVAIQVATKIPAIVRFKKETSQKIFYLEQKNQQYAPAN